MKLNFGVKLKNCTIAFGLVFLFSVANADSSCWPEEQLIGKNAIGFITGVNFSIFKGHKSENLKVAAPKKCEIMLFDSPTERNAQTIGCEKIECIKGNCGDENEYTSLPVKEVKDLFVLVALKDNRNMWLKLSSKPEITAILSLGQVGTLFPASAKVLDSPNGKPLMVSSNKKLAYTLKQIITVKKEVWGEVDVTPILSDEPPVTFEHPVGKGFFMFKNKEDKVVAVLSEIWCD